MEMTKKVWKYIEKNKIDIDSLSEATGVSRKLFRGNPDRPMNATEFLEVCAYLKINPREFT